MGVLHECLCTYQILAWYRQKSKEGVGFLGTRVIGGYGYWKSNPDPLEECPMTLAAEPALQHQLLILILEVFATKEFAFSLQGDFEFGFLKPCLN